MYQSHKKRWETVRHNKLELPIPKVQLYDEGGNPSSILQYSQAESQTTEESNETELVLNTVGYASDPDLPNDPVNSVCLSLTIRQYSIPSTNQTLPTLADQTPPPSESSSVNSASIQTCIMNTCSSQANDSNLENRQESSNSDKEVCSESSFTESEHHHTAHIPVPSQYSSIPNYKTSQPSKIAEIIGHTPEISAFDELRYQLKSRYKNTKIPQHA